MTTTTNTNTQVNNTEEISLSMRAVAWATDKAAALVEESKAISKEASNAWTPLRALHKERATQEASSAFAKYLNR